MLNGYLLKVSHGRLSLFAQCILLHWHIWHACPIKIAFVLQLITWWWPYTLGHIHPLRPITGLVGGDCHYWLRPITSHCMDWVHHTQIQSGFCSLVFVRQHRVSDTAIPTLNILFVEKSWFLLCHKSHWRQWVLALRLLICAKKCLEFSEFT